MNIVGTIESGSSTVTVCFLLYLVLIADTASGMVTQVIILLTVVNQYVVFAILGEMFNTEV